jgi:hypothetical protein
LSRYDLVIWQRVWNDGVWKTLMAFQRFFSMGDLWESFFSRSIARRKLELVIAFTCTLFTKLHFKHSPLSIFIAQSHPSPCSPCTWPRLAYVSLLFSETKASSSVSPVFHPHKAAELVILRKPIRAVRINSWHLPNIHFSLRLIRLQLPHNH